MRVTLDRETCVAMFNCVGEWARFAEDRDAGTATLLGDEELQPDRCVCQIPDGEPFESKTATRICPVNAIAVSDDEHRVIPRHDPRKRFGSRAKGPTTDLGRR